MKHLTTIKDDKWVWPANDVGSWPGQNNYGILIKHTSSVENNSDSYIALSFFSIDTVSYKCVCCSVYMV